MSELMKITNDNFSKEVLTCATPVLVDFWATWCMPCRMLAPVVDEIAAAYQGKVKVAKLNVDEAPEISQQYGVMSIPTLLVYVNGEVKDKLVGVHPKEDIERMLDKIV